MNNRLIIFCILIIGILLSSCNLEKSVANFNNKNLTAYYPFNGNANNKCSDEYHGKVFGAELTYDRFENQEHAYKFDGIDDYIEVENFGNVISSGEITLSMWVKSENSRAQFQLMLLPDNNRFAVSINYYHDNRNTIFWDYGWARQGGDSPGRLYYRPEPFDNNWHHYVFVSSIEQNIMKIYKDGKLIISKDKPLPLLNYTQKKLRIGSAAGHSYFEGAIDDIRFYNIVLTENKIKSLYTQ